MRQSFATAISGLCTTVARPFRFLNSIDEFLTAVVSFTHLLHSSYSSLQPTLAYSLRMWFPPSFGPKLLDRRCQGRYKQEGVRICWISLRFEYIRFSGRIVSKKENRFYIRPRALNVQKIAVYAATETEGICADLCRSLDRNCIEYSFDAIICCKTDLLAYILDMLYSQR